uniref:Uncharacterized protein n=1 Tax=Alexandrium monilatum TaxID=311494 RepID=A0A7S4SM91_9DINO
MPRHPSARDRASMFAPPPAQPSPVAEHETEVKEVGARIAELLGEIGFPSEEEPAQPVLLPDGEGEGVADAEASSDSDLDIYCTGDGQQRAERRLEKLLGRVNCDEREATLGEVSEWLEGRASCARQDLHHLSRMDRECVDQGAEILLALKDLREQVGRRGRDTMSSVQDFRTALSQIMRNRRASKHVSRARRSSTMPPPEPQSIMTDEQLGEAIKELQERVRQSEAQAREELRELRHAERVLLQSDEDDVADPDSGDIIAEQEKMLLLLKESIEEYETRARLVKEVNDNLHGKVKMGPYGEVIRLSQEAMRISQALQEEVSSSVLPELLAQREADQGEELKLPNEDRLVQLVAQCEALQRKSGALGSLAARMSEGNDLEEDLAAQLRTLGTGQLPQSTLLHDCLIALEEVDDDLEDSGPEAEEASKQQQQQEHQQHRTGRPKPEVGPDPSEDDVRRHAQTCLQESSSLQKKILEVVQSTKAKQAEAKAMEEEDQAVMRLLDVLEGHKALFKGALAAARHGQPVLESPPSPVAGVRRQLFSEARLGIDAGKDIMPPPGKTSFYSVVAQARCTSLGWKGTQELPPEDMSWLSAFKADEDNAYAKEALEEQENALKAMVEEEKRLSQECGELEDVLSRKVAEITTLSRTPHGGVTEHTAGLLTESAKAGHEAIKDLSRSLQALREVALQQPARLEPCLTLQERRQGVKEALEGSPRGKIAAPAETTAAVKEARNLRDCNAALLKQLDGEQAQVLERRQVQKRRKEAGLRSAQRRWQQAEREVSSRRVRQQTRAVESMRRELALALTHRRHRVIKAVQDPSKNVQQQASVHEDPSKNVQQQASVHEHAAALQQLRDPSETT